MDKDLFISAYFQRLFYQGSGNPDMSTLSDIVDLHVKTIPFENTYVLRKRQITMEKDLLFKKVITDKRGGFCMELNILLYFLLKDLGYNIFMTGATVHVSGSPGPMETHVVLIVSIGEMLYAVDVAFGANGSCHPLPLVEMKEFQFINGTFRYTLQDHVFMLQKKVANITDKTTGAVIQSTKSGAEWQNIYCFRVQPKNPSDFVDSLAYVTSHPNSVFVKGLMVSLFTDDGKLTLQDNIFTTYKFVSSGNEISVQEVLSPDKVEEVLESHFSLPALL